MGTPRIDLTEQQCGRLTVIEYLGSKMRGGVKRGVWQCVCECGNTTEIETNSLTSGHAQSCGCLQREAASRSGMKRKTHGLCKTKEYRHWAGMIFRVTNKESADYLLYNPRGIYEPWRNSFEEFYKDLGPIPKEGKKYSLERLNNNVGYFPGNVVWLELPLQARNKGQYSNNTSGVTGVCFLSKGGLGSWTATWSDANKKLHVKRFPVLRHGYEESFNLAVEYRQNILIELQKDGVFYSELHGKVRETIQP